MHTGCTFWHAYRVMIWAAGQVSLEIEVRAIKMPQKTVLTLMKTPLKSSREWFSIDDVRDRIASISESQAQLSTVQQFQFVDSSSRDEKRQRKQSCCLCSCLSFLLPKKKCSKSRQSAAAAVRHVDSQDDAFKYIDHNLSKSMHLSPSVNSVRTGQVRSNRYVAHSTHVTTANSPIAQDFHHPPPKQQANAASVDNLTTLLDLLQEKSNLLYAHLQDSSSQTRVKLLKYLEQTRGVLVLETHVNDGLVIVNICTKYTQLETLKRDFVSGKLNRDLEGCIVTGEVLAAVGVLGLKLKTLINEDDVELAEQEFA